ncbi:unnamed protein product [Sphagnum jensenii]|uniref:HAT C-terminal dimerisation domain-containing protein n=1 Tax=Sphagnum jensenii TaxID=128206 RepID=A0ABP1BE06_9BRYO
MASLLDPIMKSRLVRLGVERNQIEQAKDKLKDAMIKYAPLDHEEEDVPLARSPCVDGDTSGEFHVLSWWRRKGKDLFSILARVVRSTLCIPASSAMSENNFSDAGNTLTKKRNRLKPRTSSFFFFFVAAWPQEKKLTWAMWALKVATM